MANISMPQQQSSIIATHRAAAALCVHTGTSYSAAAPRIPAMGDRCGYGRISRDRKSDSAAMG